MNLESQLKAKGFKVVSNTKGDYSFDIVAADQDNVLAIKVLESFEHRKAREYADDLRRLAASLDVTPLVACEEGVSENSITTYRGVPFLNMETLRRILNNEESPFIYFGKGGVYVKIRGDVIRKMRVSRGMSLGDLSASLGVTRRMVYEYESGHSDATLEVAYKLVRLFGDEVLERLSLKSIAEYVAEQRQRGLGGMQAPRAVKDPVLRTLIDRLERMGFSGSVLERAPFNAAAKCEVQVKRKVVIKRNGSNEEEALTVSVARLCNSYALIVNGEWIRVIGEREVRAPSHVGSLKLEEMFASVGG